MEGLPDIKWEEGCRGVGGQVPAMNPQKLSGNGHCHAQWSLNEAGSHAGGPQKGDHTSLT